MSLKEITLDRHPVDQSPLERFGGITNTHVPTVGDQGCLLYTKENLGNGGMNHGRSSTQPKELDNLRKKIRIKHMMYI